MQSHLLEGCPDRTQCHRRRRTGRNAAHKAALHSRGGQHVCRRQWAVREASVRNKEADREGGKIRVHLLLLVTHDRIQGASPCGTDGMLLQGSHGSRLHVSIRPCAPALLDKHIPELGTCAPVPRPRPQWRDQCAQGQPERPLLARSVARIACLRGRHQETSSACRARSIRLRLARQHVRAACRRRTRSTARHASCRRHGEPNTTWDTTCGHSTNTIPH